MTLVITRREQLKNWLHEKKIAQNKIGFVPTMGALHEGHLKLIEQCKNENEICIVSVFVNPLQFSPTEDLSKYPRQFQSDFQLCESMGVHIIFAPTHQEMYPENFSTQVTVNGLTNLMCGQFRPGHFEGVATVVLLLLNLVQPHNLYLGQKDFQQVQVIKKMCQDLALDVAVQIVPTVRNENGLALSSRNVYLSPEAKVTALNIPLSLAKVAKLYLDGERSCEKLLELAKLTLKENNLEPQYLELRCAKDFSICEELSSQEDYVLALAQFISNTNHDVGMVRLIDNIVLSVNPHWIDILENLISACKLN